MDTNTAVIVDLILHTNIDSQSALLQQSKIAFIDYIASALAASQEAKVCSLASLASERPGRTPLLGQKIRSVPEYAALYNGFASHYLDYDDAQANIAGHFSTVLFSALLAAAAPNTTATEFLTAYIIGAELEGILGSLVNPGHKLKGWHSTGTIGSIGAAAAIARLKHLHAHETAQLLSLGATQSCGMGFEAGSDAKPLHSAFAARNAILAYELITKTGLSARTNPFNTQTGWLKTIADLDLDIASIRSQWLQPGQIAKPGLWMKTHPYCSAGICGAAGCTALYQQGYTLDQLREVTFHFPPGADKALRYSAPATGQEGRFSIEYPCWQILTTGCVQDDYFKLPQVPDAFTEALPKFKRAHDMEPVEKSVRLTKVTAITQNGEEISADVRNPLGSPQHPFSEADVKEKLIQATSAEQADAFLEHIRTWPDGTLAAIWNDLYIS